MPPAVKLYNGAATAWDLLLVWARLVMLLYRKYSSTGKSELTAFLEEAT